MSAARAHQSVSLRVVCGLVHGVKARADASVRLFMLKLKLADMLIVSVNEFESPLFESVSFVLKVVVVKVNILQL